MTNNVWDFQKIFDPKNLVQKGDLIKELIENQQLGGFFSHAQPPEPTGIVLSYDVEEVKKAISEAAGDHYQPAPTIRK